MSTAQEWLRRECGPNVDPIAIAGVAAAREAAGDLHQAAVAYDLAYGLDPKNEPVTRARAGLLDRLAVVEHGLRFRYIPGGAFLMGSEGGDPDEQPVHPVDLSPYWLSEIPVTWVDFCRLLDWTQPPEGMPPDPPPSSERFNPALASVHFANRIRLQYCETETTGARDWHAHHPEMRWGEAGEKTSRDLFGEPPRRNPDAPYTWDQKPMVAVSWQDAEELARRLTSESTQYGLPTEAEWEKGARGGLVGCRYSWGDEAPSPERCDYDRWNEFSLLLPRELPPNGYGLYGMCGGVWEWTADWYDARYYDLSPRQNPGGPAQGEERVLRGGSWTDCPEAVTVSFRTSGKSSDWRKMDRPSWRPSPNLGFRLVRRDVSSGERRSP